MNIIQIDTDEAVASFIVLLMQRDDSYTCEQYRKDTELFAAALGVFLPDIDMYAGKIRRFETIGKGLGFGPDSQFVTGVMGFDSVGRSIRDWACGEDADKQRAFDAGRAFALYNGIVWNEGG